jgi:hypothetical protein
MSAVHTSGTNKQRFVRFTGRTQQVANQRNGRTAAEETTTILKERGCFVGFLLFLRRKLLFFIHPASEDDVACWCFVL